VCDGNNAACPPDAVAPNTVVCRPDAGQCDVPENCDGVGKNCPPDAFELNGTPCIDGDACTQDSCQNGNCVGVPDFDACLDDFLCYRAQTTKGTPKLPILTDANALTLADQFESASFDGDFFKSVCTPANKDNEGIVDPNTHLRGRLIRSNPATPPFVRRNGLTIANQLGGGQKTDIVRREQLLTPANKSLGPPPPPAPDPQTNQVDHYKCYKVKPQKPKFVPVVK